MNSLKVTLFLLLASTTITYAQTSKLDELTIEDGLTQGMIHDILQDSLGFMWFATKDGLNRYDGYGFELYSHFPADSFSLSGHIVNVLFEDTYGRIWAGTHNNGLNIFDRKTERFYKLDDNDSPEVGLNSDRIFSIEQERDSIFWIGTGSGLCRLTVPPGEQLWANTGRVNLNHRVRSFAIEPIPNPNLNSVATCLSTVSDTLYFAISNRLFRLNLHQYHSWEEISEKIKAHTIEIPFGFRSMEMTEDGYLILPTNQEVKIYHKGKSWDIDLPLQLQGFVPDVAINKEGTIWGVSAGLYKIHPKRPKGQQLEIVFTTKPAYYTPTVCIDHTGLVWLGTNGYGIRKFNPASARFNHFMPGTSTRQLYTDQKGRCWVWVAVSLKVLNPETGRYELPSTFPSWIEKATWVINPEPDIFWFHYPIIEKQTALVRVNERTGEVIAYPYSCKPNPDSPLFLDRDGNIWFSSRDGQLVVFDTKTGTYHYQSMSDWFAERQENTAVTVFQAEPGSETVWAGTQYGLLRLNRNEDNSFNHKVYDFDINEPGSISENYILSICNRPGEPDKLWIGTKGGGLNHFDTQTGLFRSVTTKDGLPNNVAYGLLPDEEGFLWVTTNRGLSKYHPDRGTFKNYTFADGLQSNEFNTSSYHKAEDGRFLIGGVNGVHVFHPKNIPVSSLPPKVYLTGLNINNEPWQNTENPQSLRPIELVENMELKHYQDQLFFKFSALDYAAPQNNRYRYQMIGLDDAPVYAGTRREVAYANLAPGHYTFKVWGANNEDIWSSAPAVLGIVIHPPWWATYWAYLIYILLFFTLVYSAYRFQVNRDRLKTQLAYEKREAVRLAALDRMKSNFFSNITHEFRTPLTLILEPARRLGQQLQHKNSQKWAELIINNSERMLNLVNQLLDINRLEEGLMPVKHQQADLNHLLSSVLKGYEGAAQDKDIRLELEIHGRSHLKWVETDPEKVRKIIHNLLSNAFKFTPNGGQITVSANGLADSRKIEISVEDTGPGIAPEHQSQIFDRFYQVDDSSTRSAGGTGIGLALCRELARKLEGEITVSSAPGAGSCFTLKLPLCPAAAEETANSSNLASEKISTAAAEHTPAQHGTTILIVEDNADLRDFLCSILEGNFELTTAQDGIEGLQIATETLPDIIISDVMMPRLDGYDMTVQLKDDFRTSHIPVILLTAKSALESRLTGLKTGADAYLSKPFYAEELIAQIGNLLEQRNRLQHYFQGQENQGMHAPTLPDLEHEFLQKAFAVIEDHMPDEQFSIEQLSSALLLSRSQLHRKLKALTGQTASEFLRNYRLKKALDLLRQPDLSVSEVSLKVGFSSPQYFSTKFKEKYGYSPSEAHKKA